MSKAGGIAYLLKHGRAPVPTVTRTQMPRGKGYAVGGVPDTTPINNSLGYGPEYDYQFIPGGMELDASGKPVYRSGRFVRKTQPAPTTAAAQDPYARTGSSGGTRDGAELPDSGWSGMSMAEKAAYYADRPIEASLASAARGLWDSSLLGKGIGWLADKVNPEGAQERRQSGMVMDAFRNTPGSDRYGLSEDRFGWGANSGGGGYAVPVGGDAIDSAGSGEAAAAENLSRPEVQAAIQNEAPTITPAMQAAAAAEGASSENARGGVIRMAAGGIGSLQDHGGFVGSYAQGGRMLRGPGDGLSDHIPAIIGKNKPARLADGEFVVSADVVSTLGGGSTEAGAKKLYAMMDRIRKAGHGSSKQVKPVKEHKVLPA